MGKTLVIAEKPSVGRDIGRVLKCGNKIDGALEGSQYIVTWGLGHLVTLSDPEHYDKKYKEKCDKFNRKFNELNDGNVSSRFYKALCNKEFD